MRPDAFVHAGEPMLKLTLMFQKYLREYAVRVLIGSLPVRRYDILINLILYPVMPLKTQCITLFSDCVLRLQAAVRGSAGGQLPAAARAGDAGGAAEGSAEQWCGGGRGGERVERRRARLGGGLGSLERCGKIGQCAQRPLHCVVARVSRAAHGRGARAPLRHPLHRRVLLGHDRAARGQTPRAHRRFARAAHLVQRRNRHVPKVRTKRSAFTLISIYYMSTTLPYESEKRLWLVVVK